MWCSSREYTWAITILCYVNDMYTSFSADCKLILYANDSAILFAHKDPEVISQKLSEVMDNNKKLRVMLKLAS